MGFSPAVFYLQELDEKKAVVLIMGWGEGSYYVVCSPVGWGPFSLWLLQALPWTLILFANDLAVLILAFKKCYRRLF